MATTISRNLDTIRQQITNAEQRFRRPPGSVSLLAVCKRKPAEDVRAAYEAGQRCFGENHLQEALPKIEALRGLDIDWHFIGPVQSNKTRLVATYFSWVHSVDRLKIASRLNEQRDCSLPPLNVCIEVNVSNEPTKAGVHPDELVELAEAVAAMPRLRLRGLMAIPRPGLGIEAQRAPFRALRMAFESLRSRSLDLDTLSMGMSDDMEAAIAEGATIVRIGTAIFGSREVEQRLDVG